MKKRLIKYLAIILLLLLLVIWIISMKSGQTVTSTVLSAVKNNNSLTESGGEYVEGQVIIMTSSNTDLPNLKVKKNFFCSSTIEEQFNVQDIAEFDVPAKSNISAQNEITANEDYVISFIQSDEYTTEQLIKKLENVDGIISVQPNYILHTTKLTNDTYIDYQWAIENNGQNAGSIGKDINPIATSNEDERIVAVVDTGVDYNHEDLKDVMWSNTHSELGTIGSCGRDFKCEYIGYWPTQDFDDDPMDDSEIAGHGTHCAGIIAATSNNSIGVTGTNIGSNIKIMALKLPNQEGTFTTLNEIYAYQYIDKALDLGENIVAINNSYGGSGNSNETVLKTVMDSVGEKGALSICAAGNESLNIDGLDYTPATIDSQYIVTVAASDESDDLASFSNYGEREVDIAAPGSSILSTVSYNCFNPSIYSNEKIKNLCHTYENYNDITEPTGKIYCEDTDGSVTIDTNVYFGQAGGKSLKWTVENAEAGQEYKITFLFDNLEEEGTYYTSFMYTSENADRWVHPFGKVSGKEGNSKLPLTIKPTSSGTFTYYFDDFAISKAGIDESNFGKYDFMSGTSMATPYATGAAAVISSKYPDATVLERKDLLLKSIRTSSGLQGKVSTGGTLDLSNLPTYTVKPILEISQNEAKPTMGKSNELEIKNTESGKTYEYNINAAATWLPVTNNKIALTNDGTYAIKVRIADDVTTESATYYYTFDTTAPVITVDKEKETAQAESIDVTVNVTEDGSGLKEDKIYYAITKEKTTPSDESFNEASLNDGKADLTLQNKEDGNYYLYIKSVEDNVGNIGDEKKFGTYSLKGTTIKVTGVNIKGVSQGDQIGMRPGDERNFEAEVLPTNATNKNVTWSIQSLMGILDVATVDASTGTVTADSNGYGYATLTVTTEEGGYTASATILVRNFPESISFVKERVILYVGNELDLNNLITLEPSDADGLIWNIDDNTVAEVNSDGILTAKKTGTAKVTVEASNKEWETLSAELTVEVYPSLTVKKPTLDLPTDSSNATWHKEREIEIQNIETGKEYKYTTDNGKAWTTATNHKVLLTGADGTYAIKVRIEDDVTTESSTYYYKLDTTAPSVGVNVSSQTIAVEEVREEITVTDSGSGLKSNTIEYQFSTSNTAPMTGYKTTTLTEGTASVILSSSENIAGTYYLYINKVKDNVENESEVQKFGPYLLKNSIPTTVPVTGVSLSPISLNMQVGDAAQRLTATVMPSNATNQNIIWTSSDKTVATIQNGVVTAVGEGETIITVTTIDGGYTAICNVYVTDPVKTIAITEPATTTYNHGDDLDLTGGKITLTKKSGKTEEITMIVDMIKEADGSNVNMRPQASEYATNHQLTKTLKITYGTTTIDYNITIRNSIDRIEIGTNPKTIYTQNESIVNVGGTIIATRKAGDTETINIADSMVTGLDTSTVGKNKTATVTYVDEFGVSKTTTYQYTVTSLPDQVIEISISPASVIGEYGNTLEQIIHNNHIQYKVIYAQSGEQEPVDLAADMVSGYNSTTTNEQTLTITYRDNNTSSVTKGQSFTATLKVILVDRIQKIEVTTNPTKTEYGYSETFEPVGGKITVTKLSGTTDLDLTDRNVNITDTDGTEVDLTDVTFEEGNRATKTLKVSYEGKDTTFDVTVVNRITGISIAKNPKTTYVKGEELDLSGGQITIHYENGDNKTISMTENGINVSEYNKNVIGEQTVTITYEGKTATCKVTVTKSEEPELEENIPLESIAVESESIEITEGDKKAIKVTITPDNASIANITWTSSDRSVATVDQNGVVTAVGEGTAIITVTITDKDGNIKTVKTTVTIKKATNNLEISGESSSNSSSAQQSDKTTATTVIPQTGISRVILGAMIIILINAVVMFIRYKKNRIDC